jgi:hypothetical protein
VQPIEPSPNTSGTRTLRGPVGRRREPRLKRVPHRPAVLTAATGGADGEPDPTPMYVPCWRPWPPPGTPLSIDELATALDWTIDRAAAALDHAATSAAAPKRSHCAGCPEATRQVPRP